MVLQTKLFPSEKWASLPLSNRRKRPIHSTTSVCLLYIPPCRRRDVNAKISRRNKCLWNKEMQKCDERCVSAMWFRFVSKLQQHAIIAYSHVGTFAAAKRTRTKFVRNAPVMLYSVSGCSRSMCTVLWRINGGRIFYRIFSFVDDAMTSSK